MLKRIILLWCLFCVPYIALASGEKDLSPEEVVSTFYHDYLVAAEVSDMEAANELTVKAILKYTTEHLRTQRDNDDSGADYFVDAQDVCEEWKNSMHTNSISESNHDAQVNLKLGYGKGVSLYIISLVKNKGAWLIDSVKPTSRSSIYCPKQANGEE